MSFSYDATQLTNTNAGNYPGSTIGTRYQIRLLIQDTQTTRQLLQDEEIDWYQTQEVNVYTAAAACCDSLVVRAGSIKSKKISEFAIQYDPDFYRKLAMQLRARGQSYQVPYAGGISIADKLAQQADPDWAPPAVSRGLDDNPAAPSPAVVPPNPLTTI